MILLFFIHALAIDSILNQPALRTAQTGVYILNLNNDSLIYARNSQKLLMPASNMKIITTGAGLAYLGPEYRYTTRLGLRGSLVDKRLSGDIMILGGGDPTFSLADLDRFVSKIKAKGIEEVTGNIVVSEDYFRDMSLQGNTFTSERLPTGWAWHYLDARYAAEISALSINKNYVNVNIKATDIGEYADVTIEPKTQYVLLVNEMKTKDGEDSIIIYRRPEENIIYVDGGIGKGHEKDIPVAVKNPALFVGSYFKERLVAENIRVTGDVVKEASTSFQIAMNLHPVIFIDSVNSPRLVDILSEMNTESVNLYAEILLKTLGAQYYGEGTFYNGVRMLKRFLEICGADTSAVSIWDGSGLSRHNLISPYQIALVLRYMHWSRYAQTFYEFLPQIGQGTLENRFEDFEGDVRAKTGSLYAVSSLSGYLNVGETTYCFSMIFNNFTCSRRKIREMEEGIIMTLQEHVTGNNNGS
jgi:D-alanyl-D-alanine carboxypeptidase/D-alanyl-D-alanine-endopeptidase (penicillin-binding protein 4)